MIIFVYIAILIKYFIGAIEYSFVQIELVEIDGIFISAIYKNSIMQVTTRVLTLRRLETKTSLWL